MKKILFLIAALATCASCFAQDSSTIITNGNQTTVHKKIFEEMRDCVWMKNGRMMRIKNGRSMPMDKNIKMSNGTMVSTKGTVTKAGGSTIMLKDRQCVYMNGKIGNIEMNPPQEERIGMSK